MRIGTDISETGAAEELLWGAELHRARCLALCALCGARVASRARVTSGGGLLARDENCRALAEHDVGRDAHARDLLTASRQLKHRIGQRALLLRNYMYCTTVHVPNIYS